MRRVWVTRDIKILMASIVPVAIKLFVFFCFFVFLFFFLFFFFANSWRRAKFHKMCFSEMSFIILTKRIEIFLNAVWYLFLLLIITRRKYILLYDVEGKFFCLLKLHKVLLKLMLFFGSVNHYTGIV